MPMPMPMPVPIAVYLRGFCVCIVLGSAARGERGGAVHRDVPGTGRAAPGRRGVCPCARTRTRARARARVCECVHVSARACLRALAWLVCVSSRVVAHDRMRAVRVWVGGCTSLARPRTTRSHPPAHLHTFTHARARQVGSDGEPRVAVHMIGAASARARVAVGDVLMRIVRCTGRCSAVAEQPLRSR
jgi:hypothetical protein